ncbi:MAG: hypothetical protein KatS3mg008_1352 [Acidimicrobiales bacterium]|nr:MAG: hypothetical protein KatS3mg008_1352 [Acidimicrobiales bacterium]
MTDRQSTPEHLDEHDIVRELLASFALDAVEPTERSRIENHVDTCSVCRRELTEYLEAAAGLAWVGTDPPAHLWERIADELSPEPPAYDLVRLRRKRRGIRRFIPHGLAVAAALAALFMAGENAQQRRRVEDLEAALRERPSELVAQVVATTPGVRTVKLTSEDRRHYLELAVLPDGSAYVLRSRLPELRGDKTFQVWGIRDGEAISLGLMGEQPRGTEIRVDGEFELIAVTEERPGGVVVSRQQPVVAGELS